jgi:hypothetical protein
MFRGVPPKSGRPKETTKAELEEQEETDEDADSIDSEESD